MPKYDYRCLQCGIFTLVQGIKEKALDTCPTCGSPVHRVIGKNVGVVYKCSGFYCTDSRPSSSESGTKNEAESQVKAVNE